MFGVSFLEIALVGLVALVVVGPQKLPEMMRTAGEWLGRLRRMTADMRVQTGIDDILREEGIDGVGELRTLLRGERGLARRGQRGISRDDPDLPPDKAMEFPTEGADANGALPDDLFSLLEDASPSVEPSSSDALNNLTPGETDPVKAKGVEPISIPAPTTDARRISTRAETQPETPRSKSEPKIDPSLAPRPPRPGK